MNDPKIDRAEAIHQIASILATAYLRLRFTAPTSPQLDCPETQSVHGTAG
jgi:hypothetical protein